MSVPLSITFRGLVPSEGVDRCARVELDKLERTHPRLSGCDLALEVCAGTRYHDGAWRVHLSVRVPSGVLDVVHDSGFVSGQEDACDTVRAAFVAARRELLIDARRMRQDAKLGASHAALPPAP